MSRSWLLPLIRCKVKHWARKCRPRFYQMSWTSALSSTRPQPSLLAPSPTRWSTENLLPFFQNQTTLSFWKSNDSSNLVNCIDNQNSLAAWQAFSMNCSLKMKHCGAIFATHSPARRICKKSAKSQKTSACSPTSYLVSLNLLNSLPPNTVTGSLFYALKHTRIQSVDSTYNLNSCYTLSSTPSAEPKVQSY